MRTVCVQRVSKALFIRTLRWKHAVHSLPACDVFHNPDSNWVRRLWVTGTNLGQRKHNEFRTCALLVPNARLALVWRSLASTFTRGWTLTFLSMQKMCAKVDAHKYEWRSSGVLVKSLTNSDARPANHNALTKIPHFFCVGRAWWYVWLGLYK